MLSPGRGLRTVLTGTCAEAGSDSGMNTHVFNVTQIYVSVCFAELGY